MIIPTLSPKRYSNSNKFSYWIFSLTLLTLMAVHSGCENKSGITEAIDAPSITSTNPENNATDVTVTSPITAAFDQAMDPATITDSSFTVRFDTGTVNGAISYTDSTATFTPAQDLSHKSTYTATITSDVQDLSGNSIDNDYVWTFTTVSESSKKDTIPPRVISTNPKANTEKVSVSTPVSASFNEPLNPATINANTFSLFQGTTPISGNISYSGTTATMSLSKTLDFETTYTATISESIEDTTGNTLGEEFSWNFTTGTEPDNTAPTVASTDPSNDEDNVPVSTTITATFSEVVNTASIDNSTFFLERGDTRIPGSFSYSDKSVNLTPSAPLSYKTNYTVTVTTGVEDLAGNNLEEDLNWNFTTGNKPDNESPEVESVDPVSGQRDVDITTNITTNFNEAINPKTINNSTFFLRNGDIQIPASLNTSGTTATLDPTENLSYETNYTATLTTNIEDLAGNKLDKDVKWNFTTGEEPDNIAPKVISRNPDNNQQNVDIDTNIKVNFDESIDPATVSNSTFVLSANGTTITGNYNVDKNIVNLNPTFSLSYETTYSVTLNTGIKDLAGNGLSNTVTWEFTTEDEPDTSPPQLTSRNPQPNATDVNISTNVSATFNESINSSTANSNTFILEQGNTQISASYNLSGNSIVLNPSTDLSYGTTYTAILTTGIEDEAGNALDSEITWQFTTKKEPDNTAPEIRSRDPGDDQEDVDIDTNIRVDFSEDISTSTVNGSTFSLQTDNTTITGNYEVNGNRVTLKPSSNLSYETTYSVTLTTGIEDLAGNGLSNIVTWQFSTEEEPDNIPPVVSTTTPSDGATDIPVDIAVSVTFSEAMNPETVNKNSFIVTRQGKKINGTIPDFTGATARFVPDEDLKLGTQYTVTITDDVEDLAGNKMDNNYDWSFTTEQESIPPTIIDTHPADNETEVPLETIISVTFSEAINPTTVNESSFTVSNSEGNPVTGNVNSTDDPTIFTFLPSDNLVPGETYSVLITTDVQDLAGNALQKDYTWNFSTELENNEEDD